MKANIILKRNNKLALKLPFNPGDEVLVIRISSMEAPIEIGPCSGCGGTGKVTLQDGSIWNCPVKHCDRGTITINGRWTYDVLVQTVGRIDLVLEWNSETCETNIKTRVRVYSGENSYGRDYDPADIFVKSEDAHSRVKELEEKDLAKRLSP